MLINLNARGKFERNKLQLSPLLFLILFIFLFCCGEAFTLKMGVLTVGVPQKWDRSKKNLTYVRKAGVKQFISTFNRVKDLKGDELLWGDEVEYGIFHLDHAAKKIRLSLRAKQVMDELNDKELSHVHRVEGCNWVPEYGAWMIEATPLRPYTGYANDLLRVERNMRLRRRRLLTVLKDNEIAPTVSVFPLLGALGNDGTVPPTEVGGPITESAYIGDSIINPHPRFGTLSGNIRKRRGEKVNIRVPLFRDVNTPEYKDYQNDSNNGVCCGSGSLQLWRYGKGDRSMEKYGYEYVEVGCSSSAKDDEFNESMGGLVTLQKWLVHVEREGCKGLYYRSAPNVIVPDADWPRNGDVVVGREIPDIPGWIRLQNGYYLPIESECGCPFLHKVSSSIPSSNTEKRNLGSTSPTFYANSKQQLLPSDINGFTTLLEQKLTIKQKSSAKEDSSKETKKLMEKSDVEKKIRPAVHMDAMAFGMGCTCLQITFQATDMDESRFIYDQLAVVAPIMMALTASTSILKGRLCDTDSRWGVISEAVDDRTLAERGRDNGITDDSSLAGRGKRRIYKSRYDSISTYIYQGANTLGGKSMENRVRNMYNDIPVPIDEESYALLREAGVDPALSQHIAHLFIRDPLVIFDGAVEDIDDETRTDHFESIQSTNWQTVRWKPPPPRNSPNDPHIGWRTEFRSMETQLTDFENAAFTVFIVLLTRVILTFDLNLYIPLSRVDANMQRAHSRNAAASGKFFFRRHMAPLQEGDDGYGVKYSSMFAEAVNGVVTANSNSLSRIESENDLDENGVSQQRRKAPVAPGSDEENSYEEMTMVEIMTGKGDYFPGLIPLVRAHKDYINCDDITNEKLTEYLDFIEKRATGDLITPASWMRKFVRKHPGYKGDSILSEEIGYDLMVACKEIGEGARHESELLGDKKIVPIKIDGSYDVKLAGTRGQNDDLVNLLRRYAGRKSFSSEK